jgi:DNA-binding NtrC family response regulator
MAHLSGSVTHDPDTSAAGPSAGSSGAFRRRTVLLVDDDIEVLALLDEVITALGHRVIKAHDGEHALKCLLKYRSIDCIFTDVVMPNGMSGLQLMTAARAVRPGLPAMVASAYSREVVSALGDIPADVDFIAKPYLLTDLFELLDRQAAEPAPPPAKIEPARPPGRQTRRQKIVAHCR